MSDNIIKSIVVQTSMSGNQVDVGCWENRTPVYVVKEDKASVHHCPPVQTLTLKPGQIAIIIDGDPEA